jgi:hypothetical protein
MHEIGPGGGLLDKWLAIIGVIVVMYAIVRIGMRIMAQRSVQEARAVAAAVPTVSAVAGLGKQVAEQPPGDDIVAIAAAVHAMLGGGWHIVHLEADRMGTAWAIEGRWAHQTSHQPRR